MKKLSFYGVEDRGGEGRFLYNFPFLKDLRIWMDEQRTFARYQEYATGPIVRRTLRRMAADPSLTWPVLID